MHTPLTAQQLEQVLRVKLNPTKIEVLDESAQHAGHGDTASEAAESFSGSGTHFRVRITLSEFAHLSRISQHRLVYDALRPFWQQGLHALAIDFF